MHRARVKTGERRKRHQPFAIDKLPADWRERIISLRARWVPFEQIEEESTRWEWEKLPVAQQALYPGRRIPMRTLHRWYDVQVTQNVREVLAQRAASMEVAAKLGAAGYEKLDESVKNAIADVVFDYTTRSSDPERFRKTLLELGWLLARNRQLDIAKEKVGVERMKIEELSARADRATSEAAKKLRSGKGVTLEDINRLRQRTFGLPPIKLSREVAGG